MTVWFFVLGIPVLALGLFAALAPESAGRGLLAFPRHVLSGRILCAIAWFFTAYACDGLGIDVFDRFLKAFPGELWILATVLTVLTCWWMDNLLPIRGLCGILMLFPSPMFEQIRECETTWRISLSLFAYLCLVVGMFGMFYPWRIRQALTWICARRGFLRGLGTTFAAVGVLFVVLGSLCWAGVLA